jgi:hypothetical protein
MSFARARKHLRVSLSSILLVLVGTPFWFPAELRNADSSSAPVSTQGTVNVLLANSGSGANMCEGRNKASGGVATTLRVPHSKLQGQFGS